ncbi:Cell Wall Hydrolase [compost metagenome]
MAQVVLNRVRDPNYPNTVCGVVYQGAERTTGCQFSFTCDGALARAPIAWAWTRAARVAERALAGHVATRVGTATHYHADYVHPWWSPTLAKITQVGAHIFYRWKGAPGESKAFVQRSAGREPVIDEARFARPRILLAADSVEEALAGAAPNQLRTVEIDGQTRVVGIASLGGRRQASKEEIAAINERLKAYEATPAPAVAVASPPGVTAMAVEEVGKPAA